MKILSPKHLPNIHTNITHIPKVPIDTTSKTIGHIT